MASDDQTELIDPEQTSLFGDEHTVWFSEWQGMPEFVQENRYIEGLWTMREIAADIEAWTGEPFQEHLELDYELVR